MCIRDSYIPGHRYKWGGVHSFNQIKISNKIILLCNQCETEAEETIRNLGVTGKQISRVLFLVVSSQSGAHRTQKWPQHRNYRLTSQT